jgi:hypothetical protein
MASPGAARWCCHAPQRLLKREPNKKPSKPIYGKKDKARPVVLAISSRREVRTFSPSLTTALSPVVLGFIAFYCWMKEGEGATLVFTLAATGCVLAVVALLSRRLLFSSLATAGFVAGVVSLSWLKRDADDMSLHAWDIVVFLTSPARVFGWVETDRPALLAAAALVAVACGSLWLVYRRERTRVRRVWSALALVLCGIATAVGGAMKPEQGHTQFFWDDLHLASFYASVGEAAQSIGRGGLMDAAWRSSAAPFSRGNACAPGQSPPHIILIHEESIASPDIFPGLDYDRGLMPFFNSDDGKLHRLRVETYGGASWLTEFSVFAGVSSRAYGSMRNFVQIFAAGKIKEALPRVLADCGFKNIMFTPWDKTFMAVARFYESIGFDEIIDRRAQGNKRDNERDRFFFTNALNRVGAHVETSRQPLFLFIETMSAHWPYDEVYMPEEEVVGGGPGTPPQMSEYLRRLAMVKMDDEWLRAELAKRFPRERFLIVRYGDHHPTATLPLLGQPSDMNAEDTHFPDDSLAFITFYATNGVNYVPPAPPTLDVVDVGYLGAVLLDAARLPAPPSWRERTRLMTACDGKYWTCADHDAILTFHRRLIDGGLVGSR